MQLSYARYLDQVLGGWIGKSMGGAIGARFEGNKGWIEIQPEEMFPQKIPPNDDLDLQVLWLKVLEEKGAALTADDLAAAWLEGCWYPFNEYGIFRRNWRLGLHPPVTGRFTNQFWDTGMGCPIRAEIWGYVFPGAPDLAARYAGYDGSLDHGPESLGAEQMFAAMSSMAFFVPDVRRLAGMFLHYLPPGSTIDKLTRAALQAHAEGLSLREARQRLMFLGGNPEACDSRTNVPFTFLGLLYGNNDLQETMLAALRCGYDTDCTLATAAALQGQILGASRIPEALKKPIGDALVMGIEYHRPEMTLTALARDTAAVGVRLACAGATGVTISSEPALAPLPGGIGVTPPRLSVSYAGRPAAGPGESVRVTVTLEGPAREEALLTVRGPAGWTCSPGSARLGPARRTVEVNLGAPAAPGSWPMKNLFTARLESAPPLVHTFGVAGAGLWKFLGAYYDALPDEKDPVQKERRFNHHFASLAREYISEPPPDEDALFAACSRALGRPAVVPSYEHEVDLSAVLGLTGPCCVYLSRTLLVPDDRPAWFVIGNGDGYRLWLNGEKIAEKDEVVEWTPFNNTHKVQLRKGANKLFLKLLRRRDPLRFTFGVREVRGQRVEWGHNCQDWMVDLADEAP